jgi:hypothetical protein
LKREDESVTGFLSDTFVWFVAFATCVVASDSQLLFVMQDIEAASECCGTVLSKAGEHPSKTLSFDGMYIAITKWRQIVAIAPRELFEPVDQGAGKA